MTQIYKYIELLNHFSSQQLKFIRLTFDEIENIIGFNLPKSGYRYKAYWYPSKTHTICKAWTDNNYKMIHVSLGEYIEFKRIE